MLILINNSKVAFLSPDNLYRQTITITATLRGSLKDQLHTIHSMWPAIL